MARICTVCSHAERQQIDLALLQHRTGYRDIARRFGLDFRAVYRHEGNCLHSNFRLSEGLTAMLSADNLLAKLGEWHERMEQQYHKADVADEIANAATVATSSNCLRRESG